MVGFGVDIEWLLSTTGFLAPDGGGVCKRDGGGDELVRVAGEGAGADVACSAG
jgi:hypothetical protein